MASDKICKTVHQYNKKPISSADMKKLQEIAKDYSKVKNYVYQRYGGIGSLTKIYSGYTVQNEMTAGGLRSELGLPSVYFNLAVFDALGDIKARWSLIKTEIGKTVRKNSQFGPEDIHYLNFVLRVSICFNAIVQEKEVIFPEKSRADLEMKARYGELAGNVDQNRLDAYLRRAVRKQAAKLHTENENIFTIAERAYRYGDHGIYISTKENRKRVFVELTDNNSYLRQLKIKLYPEEGNLEILIPIDIKVKKHADYQEEVGVAMGINTMLTTDSGHTYGEKYGEYHRELSDYVRSHTGSYAKNRKNNPGLKKYTARKRKLDAKLDSYINHELNRFIRQERPKLIYVPKLPGYHTGGNSGKVNNFMALWKRGYIRDRMLQKCMENSVEMIEVFGRDISNECSQCGAVAGRTDQRMRKEKGFFICGRCGFQIEEKINTARNAKKEWRRS